MSREYRCTRNASYSHKCLGHNDLTARQGHYVWAEGEEEAWQKMATRFPEEAEAGFTVQAWEGFNVKVVELKRDAVGNLLEIERDEEGNMIQVRPHEEQ